MSTAKTPRGFGSHLTMAQRAELVELIGGQPLATCGMIARIFEERTGRAIHPGTVRRAWVGDYREPGEWSNRPLTEAQRATLARICRGSGPAYNRRQIARRFEAETGRRITRTTVRDFLRKALGITEPAPNGRPRKAVTA